VLAPPPSPIEHISAGRNSTFFLDGNGDPKVCGSNGYGLLGNGSTSNVLSPSGLSGVTNVQSIASGGAHSLFLKNDGTVWACGQNYARQLGDGTTEDQYNPVQVQGF
jgi:alpha-tubulin suppressor-like RCC1 family protein